MNEHIRDKIKIHLDIMAKSKPLESYCTNCGACCRPGVEIRKSASVRRISVNDLSCKFMKSEGDESQCAVYAQRFEKAPWCVNTQEMLVKGLVPLDCPYAEGIAEYVPTTVLSKGQYSQLVPLLRLGISNGSREPYDKAAYEEFMCK